MDAPRYCYRHPDRETGLSCSECGRPICYECMTPAPVGIRCPEHSGKPQGMQKVTRAAERAVTGVGGRRVNAVTLGLIAVNVGVALIELASGSGASFTNNSIFEKGSLFATGYVSASGQLLGVAHGEWWRLFTSMFLHASFFHLAVNMYSLYFVGSIMEQVIGRWRFLLLYLASGLAGSAGALVWSPLTPTVGASGAIFGILGGLFILERRRHIATGGQVAGIIVLNLVITFAFSGSISVGGHVGGLIGGTVLMLALLQFGRSAFYSIAAVIAVSAAAVIVAYAKVRNYQ
ncbi:MAG TPA: rhomboid family intramembrane serine protease [Gaiellaceae bacterium]|nr:rhomboid family intramembrane serine protease [Gaiellaceae bacterium]